MWSVAEELEYQKWRDEVRRAVQAALPAKFGTYDVTTDIDRGDYDEFLLKHYKKTPVDKIVGWFVKARNRYEDHLYGKGPHFGDEMDSADIINYFLERAKRNERHS